MRRVQDASAASLIPFVEESVEAGSVVHTDGWLGYEPLETKGYVHRISYLDGQPKRASELLPRVHKAASLLKRWLLGTHQGAVSHEHLDYYLDEFVFRFNRRTSRSRGNRPRTLSFDRTGRPNAWRAGYLDADLSTAPDRQESVQFLVVIDSSSASHRTGTAFQSSWLLEVTRMSPVRPDSQVRSISL